jgi:hypothetical protein
LQTIGRNSKGRQLVTEGIEQRRDFSRVIGGKQSCQINNRQGEGGRIVVKTSTNPLGNIPKALEILQNQGEYLFLGSLPLSHIVPFPMFHFLLPN